MQSDIIIEIFGAVTGLLFVYLEIRQRREMWMIGGISALIYIAVFLNSGLLAAMGLQVYYLGVSLYGWKKWGAPDKEEPDTKQTVSRMSLMVFVVSTAIAAAAYLVLAYLLKEYSKDPMPQTDAFIAAISMLATYWVTRKYIENWYLWIIANSLSLYLYINQGLYATTVLYFVYLTASFVGYIHWRKFRKL